MKRPTRPIRESETVFRVTIVPLDGSAESFPCLSRHVAQSEVNANLKRMAYAIVAVFRDGRLVASERIDA